MRLLINGKPIIHHHECPPDRIGQLMTAAELHDFAADSLTEEYRLYNQPGVVRHSEDFKSGADFSFKDFGETICGKVICLQNFDYTREKLDEELLSSNYETGNILPRLYFAHAKRVNSDGKSIVCGGDYIFTYLVKHFTYDDYDEPDEKLSHTDLLLKYIELWETGDTSIAEIYFAPNFRCYSRQSFNQIVSREEYIKFFKFKAQRANHDNSLLMCLGRNVRTNEIVILARMAQFNHDFVVSVLTEDGIITASKTSRRTEEFVVYNPDEELYQAHKEHIDAIMPSEKFIKQLPDMINSSIGFHTTYLDEYKIFALRHNNTDLDFITLIQTGKSQNSQFITSFPYLTGETVTAEIVSVLVWNNKLEATIKCKINDFEFAFFATDYYMNRDFYTLGSKHRINLSALGLKVTSGDDGFSFTDQTAVDFLSKIGEKPTLNEDGDVEPVNFSLKELVYYLMTDDRCPDEAEFHSPIDHIERTAILGNDFYKADIILNRDSDISVPLYFPQSHIECPSSDHPIQGWLWLMGNLILSPEDEDTRTLSEIGADFYRAIYSRPFRDFVELNYLMHPLKDVSLPDGFDLDAVRVGDICDNYTQLYATRNERKFRPRFNQEGEVCNEMEDNMFLCNLVSDAVGKVIPPLEKNLIVLNTKAGIWSAFLLFVSKYILPKYKSDSINRHYLFFLDDFAKYNALNFAAHDFNDEPIRNIENLPKMIYHSKNSGIIKVCYWDKLEGIISESYNFVWHDNKVVFSHSDYHILA